jgi:sugar phosphate isomerase/epimerase
MGIGLQLYTVRDETAKDFRGVLREVAAMGYEGVEFAGYGDIPAEEMRSLLDELNLKAIGSHVGFENLLEDADREFTYLQTIGAKHCVVPYLGEQYRSTPDQWRDTFRKFAELGQEAKKRGLEFGYHNHAFEFEVKVGGEFAFDALYANVPADLLKVELDLGWVQYAGQDPAAYIRKYKGRLPLLHLKDFRRDNPEANIDTVELGRGELKLMELIEAGSDADVEWLIVEQDRCAVPSLQAVKTSVEWLKENYLSRF